MMEKEWQEIDKWIDQHHSEMVEDLKRLVQIRSVSDNRSPVSPYGSGCRAAMEEMLRICHEHGLFTRCYDGHVGCAQEKDTQCDIALWAHLDVVDEGEGWLYPPYEGVIKGDYMIGRGCADNKGPLIACLYALCCLRELGLSRHLHAGVFFGCSEETGMQDVAFYLQHHHAPALSIVADSGFPVCYGECGSMNIRLSFLQPLGNTVRHLSAGLAPNMVPDWAEMILKTMAECPDTQEVQAARLENSCVRLVAYGMGGHTAFPQGSYNAIAVLATYVLEHCPLTEEGKRQFFFLQQLAQHMYGEYLGLDTVSGMPAALYCIPTILELREGHISVVANLRYPSGDCHAEDPTILSETMVMERIR